MTNEPNAQLASIYLLPCKLHSRSTEPVSANEKNNQQEIYRLQTRWLVLNQLICCRARLHTLRRAATCPGLPSITGLKDAIPSSPRKSICSLSDLFTRDRQRCRYWQGSACERPLLPKGTWEQAADMQRLQEMQTSNTCGEHAGETCWVPHSDIPPDLAIWVLQALGQHS